MICLTCTQCKAQLEMDDAFAGGVCRCQYCGTIQTVPSHLKNTATTASPQPAAARSLYSKATVGGNGTTNSGIYELADAVGSGSTGSGLQQRRPAAQPQPPARAKPDYATPSTGFSNLTKMLLVASGGVILVLIIVIFWLITARMNSTASPVVSNPAPKPTVNPVPTPAPAPTPAPPAPAPDRVVAQKPPPKPPIKPPTPAPAAVPFARPTFLNVPLTGNRIAYVIDRGDKTRQYFDTLKEGFFKSLESLGPDREFHAVWWKKTTGPNPNMQMPSFPKKGFAKATPDQIQRCRGAFDRTAGGGKTHINEAIAEALGHNPDAIIIATAKGKMLDSDFLSTIEEAMGSRKIPVFTFALGDNGGNAVLKTLAEKTGGSYWEISSATLGQ